MSNLKKIYIEPEVDKSLLEELKINLEENKEVADLILGKSQNLWDSKIGKSLLSRFEGGESSIHTDVAFKDALDDIQIIKILDLNLPGYYVDLISTNMEGHALQRELIQKDMFSIFHQLFCLFKADEIQLPIDLEFGKNSKEVVLQLSFNGLLENKTVQFWIEGKSSLKILDSYHLKSSSKTIVSFVWSEEINNLVEITSSKDSFNYDPSKKDKNTKVSIDTRELEPSSKSILKSSEISVLKNIVDIIESNQISGLGFEEVSEIIKGHPQSEILEIADVGVEEIINEYMLTESGREKIKEEYSKIESSLMEENLISMVIKSIEETTIEELNVISNSRDKKEETFKIKKSSEKLFDEIIRIKGEDSSESKSDLWKVKRLEITKELKNREKDLLLIKNKSDLEKEIESIFGKQLKTNESRELYQAIESGIITDQKKIIDKKHFESEKFLHKASEMSSEVNKFERKIKELEDKNKYLNFQLKTTKEVSLKKLEEVTKNQNKKNSLKAVPLTKNEELGEHFKKTKEKNLKLKKKVKVINNRLVQLSENLNGQKEISESRLTAESKKLRAENNKLTKELESLRIKNRSSEIKVSELEAKINIQKISNKKSSTPEEKNDLKTVLAKKEKQFNELELSMRNLENRERAAIVKIKSLEQKIKFLNVRLESSGRGITGRERRSSIGSDGKIRKLEQQNELLSQSKEKFKKELIMKKGELQKARIENSSLKSKITELERKTSKKSA